MGIPGRKVEVSGAALRIESRCHSYGFQQRRFAGAVLAYKKRHRRAEFDMARLHQVLHGGYIVQIRAPLGSSL